MIRGVGGIDTRHLIVDTVLVIKCIFVQEDDAPAKPEVQFIIMMITLSKELQQAVRLSQGQPVRVADPETEKEYVVIPAEIFKQIEGLMYQDDPLTTDEKQYLLIQAGLRAGWDDPEMDIYNDLDTSN